MPKRFVSGSVHTSYPIRFYAGMNSVNMVQVFILKRCFFILTWLSSKESGTDVRIYSI